MALDKFDAIFYAFAFLVPGFILHSTVAMLIPQKERDLNLSLLRFLVLSSMNYAIWSWLIYLIFHLEFFNQHPFRSATAWGCIILISPIVIGLLIGHFSQKEFFRKILQRIGLNPIHTIPTGWDYKFSKTKEPSWVIITLKNGSKIAGLYGTQSFASSDTKERDIYIQQVFQLSVGQAWNAVQRSDGILISKDQISSIEFFK